MTIDEAIKERQKLIEVQEKLYEEASTNESKEIIKSATDNDRQLAEWLTELKEAKRLLKMAVEFRKSGYCTKNCSECVASPCDYIDWFKNMYDNEIEKLIGETNDEP